MHLTHKALTTADLIIIGIYFAVVFGIGFYFARRKRTSTEHLGSARKVRLADYPPSESDTANTCLIECGNPLTG